jgi:NADPH2:quinone reductase
MRALVADSSSPDGIAFREVPEPLPSPGEVLVEVQAFSINRGEMRALGTAADGWRPGWDFAGLLASDIEGGPSVGTRVVGIREGESWAERVAVRREWIAELPPGVSFASGAALPTAGLTALRTLRLGPAILGRRVLVSGASGGVGRFAIQLAHLGGAEVTALVSSASGRASGLVQLGADAVVSDVADLRGRFDLILGPWSCSETAPTNSHPSMHVTSTSTLRHVFKASNCSSRARLSVEISPTSPPWWPSANSIPNSPPRCPGARCLPP